MTLSVEDIKRLLYFAFSVFSEVYRGFRDLAMIFITSRAVLIISTVTRVAISSFALAAAWCPTS
jgi:hypothetical protein